MERVLNYSRSICGAACSGDLTPPPRGRRFLYPAQLVMGLGSFKSRREMRGRAADISFPKRFDPREAA